MCGLVISVLLHIANHQEDFLYLYDARNMIREKLAQAKDALNQYGQNYREMKEIKEAAQP